MARIRFNIKAALARWRQQGAVSSRRFTMMDLKGGDDRPRGPGWYDSSWDLGHGLAIEVALPGDPGFRVWLDAQARALMTPISTSARPPLPDGALEFEAIDWKAWATPATTSMPAAAWAAPSSALPGLAMMFDTAPLELELLPA